MVVFSDVSFTGESIVVVTALVVALVGAIGMLFKLLMAAKDQQLKDMTNQRNSYRDIATEAVAILDAVAARESIRTGTERLPGIAPVLPEHSSPSSILQRDVASLQTLRARLVALHLELGMPIAKEN